MDQAGGRHFNEKKPLEGVGFFRRKNRLSVGFADGSVYSIQTTEKLFQMMVDRRDGERFELP